MLSVPGKAKRGHRECQGREIAEGTVQSVEGGEKAVMDIVQAINDSNLFRPLFRDLSTWKTWIVFLKAIFALEMDRGERQIFRRFTGGRQPPTKEAKEVYIVAGRRSGKSFMISLIAVYLAVFHSYQQYLAVGEKAVVMLLARDRIQSRIILRYIKGILNSTPMLSQMVLAEKVESIELNNDVIIAVHTADYRAVRGYSIATVILEECAFWPTGESASPDSETLAAIRPAMLTIPTSKLLGISSPYSRTGILYDAYKNHFGKGGDILVIQVPTTTLNPTIPQKEIDRAFELDPESAKAEFNAEFRSDIESFISREAVEAVTIPGRYELPAIPRVQYYGFVDPSGGSRDSFTLAVSHREKDLRILDVVRETRPPFSPQGTVEEFSTALKNYRITKIVGDRYGGEFPRELFRKHGIAYEVADKAKSDIYKEFLPLVNSGQCELLDHKKMINQLLTLERRTARGGRDSIDHPPNAHDDLINAAAGALVGLEGKKIVRSL